MAAHEERTSVLQQETIVDVDVHIQMRSGDEGEELLPYLDEPHKTRMRTSRTGKSVTDGWDRSVKGKSDLSYEESKSQASIYRTICEEFHIDVPIINTFGAMTRKPEADWALALMRAHNDFLVEEILDAYDNFKGVANLTTQKPALVAEEIDRVAEDGFAFDYFRRKSAKDLQIHLMRSIDSSVHSDDEIQGMTEEVTGNSSSLSSGFPLPYAVETPLTDERYAELVNGFQEVFEGSEIAPNTVGYISSRSG
jgi:hypothetical protein